MENGGEKTKPPTSPATTASVRVSTASAGSTEMGQPLTTPPPIHFNPWREKKWNILLYWSAILFCNVALPCVIYYPIRDLTSLSLQDAIGAGSASLGVSAIFEFPLRLYKLWRYREEYGPLNDPKWWHFDSFMYAYTLAMLVASVPLAVAPAINPPLVTFFLMFTAMLIGQMGVNMIPTLFNWRPWFWISSSPPGTPIKPAVFHLVEDICAVDAGKGRKFREEWNARYDASPPFRSLMYWLTVFWVVGCLAYIGFTAAVTFTTPVDFAYAFTLGQLFVWGAIWYAATWIWVRIALKREKKWFAAQAGNPTKKEEP